MDFWNDDTTPMRNEKCGLKKYIKIALKLKLKN
jgi:hypothetical protein